MIEMARDTADVDINGGPFERAYGKVSCFNAWLRNLDPEARPVKQQAIILSASLMPYGCATYYQVTNVARICGLDVEAAADLWFEWCRANGYAVLTDMSRVKVPFRRLSEIIGIMECGGTEIPWLASKFRESPDIIKRLKPDAYVRSDKPWLDE